MNYDDFEVVGLDTDCCVIQWDAASGTAYNSGQTVAEFGLSNMSDTEQARCAKA